MRPSNRHPAHSAPRIADHQSLCSIGQGGYGEVWLALSSFGTYRAVKVVYRDWFQDTAPYTRELNGIRRYEPISRSHPNLVQILQVGTNETEGYFYYVMELADDASGQHPFSPEHYRPKSLATLLGDLKRLPVEDSVAIGIALAHGLDFLHSHNLIHRDIKPNNVIFVNGTPKLADIGLIAESASAQTYVGTDGYIAPEGPNSTQADIFSLGILLYEISMGMPRTSFPKLPTDLDQLPETTLILELNQIILKSTRIIPQQRYSTAKDIATDLQTLAAMKDNQALPNRRGQFKRSIGKSFLLIVLIAVIGAWLNYQFLFKKRHQTPSDPNAGSRTTQGFSSTVSPQPNKISTPAFTPPMLFPVGKEAARGSLGDLDGDSHPDIAIANFSSDSVTIYRHTGKRESPLFEGRIDLPCGTDPYEVHFADLDDDGRLDLIIGSVESITLYRNESRGGQLRFAGRIDLASVGDASHLTVEDLDRDGLLDLAFANYRLNHLSILRGVKKDVATNAFSLVLQLPVGLGPSQVSSADLNLDGRPDLCISCSGGDCLVLYENTGERDRMAFDNRVDLPAQSKPFGMTVADVNRDAKPDIVLGCYGSREVLVFTNGMFPGKILPGSMVLVARLPQVGLVHSPALGDLDGDGWTDLIIPAERTDTVTVLPNGGQGNQVHFRAPLQLFSPINPHQIFVRDLDGDGRLDLTVINWYSDNFAVFLNRTSKE